MHLRRAASRRFPAQNGRASGCCSEPFEERVLPGAWPVLRLSTFSIVKSMLVGCAVIQGLTESSLSLCAALAPGFCSIGQIDAEGSRIAHCVGDRRIEIRV